jgi:hypothetical protein
LATNGNGGLSVKGFLSLLVLLYAALVPAGLWVKGEIRSSIREAITAGTIVAKDDLDAREAELRDELSDQFANGLGPIVSYIASVDERLSRVSKTDVNKLPRLIVRESAVGKHRTRTWEWSYPPKE